MGPCIPVDLSRFERPIIIIIISNKDNIDNKKDNNKDNNNNNNNNNLFQLNYIRLLYFQF